MSSPDPFVGPGGIPAPVGFSGLLRASWALYRGNFSSLLILFLPLGAALAFNIAPLALNFSPKLWVGFSYGLVVVQIVIGALAVGTAALLLSDRLVGRPTVATGAVRQTQSHLGPLFASGLAASLLFILLLQLFGPLAIFIHSLLFGPAIIAQVIVLEGTDLKAALTRTGSLLTGSKLRTFMYLFTVALGISLLTLILTLVIAGSSSAVNEEIFATVGTLIQILVTAVVEPFVAAAMLVAYFDLRARREGFGPAELRAEREAAA